MIAAKFIYDGLIRTRQLLVFKRWKDSWMIRYIARLTMVLLALLRWMRNHH